MGSLEHTLFVILCQESEKSNTVFLYFQNSVHQAIDQALVWRFALAVLQEHLQISREQRVALFVHREKVQLESVRILWKIVEVRKRKMLKCPFAKASEVS